MAKRKSTAPPESAPIEGAPTPADDSLAALRAAAAGCRRCELWEDATQTVFGEGPDDARVLVVGEQPGDEEDLRGRPFVGPAGKLFDKAIAELELDRSKFYVTNAVKHFRFEMRGSFRLHRSPAPSQQRACHIWLERELATVKPDIVVCLGAIAAKAVFGPKFRLMEQRGLMQRLPDGPRAFATVHPSWVLRQRNAEEREQAWANFLDDLRLLKRRR
jgi:DNA polymerase